LELIFADASIEVSGFTLDEIDHIALDAADAAMEEGPVAPGAGAIAVARIGDVFDLGPHRIICGSATDPETLRQVIGSDAPARLVLTDEPYNVPIAGHVTGGRHREFGMASGEMTDAEFLAFNEARMAAVLPCLCDGGVFGSFIDWRGYPTVHSAAFTLGLKPLNLVVWTKTNAGMGSLYRSQHELLPLFKNGSAPHVNNIELGKRGGWRSNVWSYPGASSLGSVSGFSTSCSSQRPRFAHRLSSSTRVDDNVEQEEDQLGIAVHRGIPGRTAVAQISAELNLAVSSFRKPRSRLAP
jgi:hypothetical protein